MRWEHDERADVWDLRLDSMTLNVGRHAPVHVFLSVEDCFYYLRVLGEAIPGHWTVAEVAKKQTRAAMERAAAEIDYYAHRNAMEVLAEAMVDVD